MEGIAVKIKCKTKDIKEKVKDFFIHPRYLSGITVIELVLILVKNFPLYIACIEGEKTLKSKLYTLYTQ